MHWRPASRGVHVHCPYPFSSHAAFCLPFARAICGNGPGGVVRPQKPYVYHTSNCVSAFREHHVVMLFKSSVLRVCPRRVPSSRRLRWAFDNPVALDVWRERSWNADWVSRRDGCRSCSSTSNSASGTGDFKPPNIGRPPPRIATFVEPPTELLARCFERPTPILLVAGECRSAAW